MPSLRELLETGLRPQDDKPLFPGAVALLMRDGAVIEQAAVGEAVRYGASGDDSVLLPLDERTPMQVDTIFDVASLTKQFTAVTVLSLIDDGKLTLGTPAADFIPEWSDDERRTITVHHLLTHTSGLPAVKRLWEVPAESRLAAIADAQTSQPPGASSEYSCVGYIVLGLMLERLTGKRLDDIVRAAVVDPLGLTDTTYRPSADLVPRIAATEHQPYAGRGMVHGEVHDEASWSLSGLTGNAGLFSTAADIARFGEMLRRGGKLDDTRILRPETVAAMTTDRIPADLDPGYRQGYGPRINDRNFMGVLADHHSFGHTGFTGTSLVVTPELQQVAVLLTNRVHPSREWSDISEFRRQFAAWTTSDMP